MILGRISYIDCAVFLCFLAPQLLVRVGFWVTLVCAVGALPFLALQLPLQFLWERFCRRREQQSPFVRQASPFQDFVIRCVRYAFAEIPASIGRVFFSKQVALPFLRFRMLRHGWLRSPIYWRDVHLNDMKGVWMIADENKKPDVVVYYCHGGGFSMGSSYFYLEFLLVWISLLRKAGFGNPAIFALEYTLVPDAIYPCQLDETLTGYDHILSIIHDPSRICVAGDSAGATLILSSLLHLASDARGTARLRGLRTPGLAILISPWVTLISTLNRDTPSDYLNVSTLHRYASEYMCSADPSVDPRVSPGRCRDASLWRAASPTKGIFVLYGSEEVFGPEIKQWTKWLKAEHVNVQVKEAEGSIHAWPVATLFLAETRQERVEGLSDIVDCMRARMIAAGG